MPVQKSLEIYWRHFVSYLLKDSTMSSLNGKPLKLVNQFNKTYVAISDLLKDSAISSLNGKPQKLVDQYFDSNISYTESHVSCYLHGFL